MLRRGDIMNEICFACDGTGRDDNSPSTFCSSCNGSGEKIQRTCWNCGQREGEECGISGHEVWDDGEEMDCFEE